MMPASQLVILCVLAEGPATGYVIMKRIKEQSQGNPNVIPKNIYSTGGGLEVLTKKKLIDVSVSRIDRTWYSITPLGMKTLQDQVVNLSILRGMCINAFWNYHRQPDSPTCIEQSMAPR